MSHSHTDMIWRGDAVGTVCREREAALQAQQTESVELDAVAGRTLAREIVGDEDAPAYDHATMDGYAFDATDGYPLTIADSSSPKVESLPVRLLPSFRTRSSSDG